MKNKKIAFIIPKPQMVTKGKEIPLGLLYIGSVLKQNNYEPIIYDLTLDKYNDYDVISELQKQNIKIVGLSFGTDNRFGAFDLCKKLKIAIPDIKIIAGGWHVSSAGMDTMKHIKEIDFIVLHEGEETVLELINAFYNKTPFKNVNGIIYRVGFGIVETPRREFIKDLDTIPWPDRSLINLKDYNQVLPYDSLMTPSTSIITARGCPYRCLVGVFEVFTTNGNKKIYELKIGDKIIGYDTKKKIIKNNKIYDIIKGTTKDYLRIYYELNGKEKVLKVTQDHKIYTKHGWIEAQYLTENDEILLLENFNIDIVNIEWTTIYKIKKKTNRIIDTYDIVFKNKPHNFFANNILVHNCSYCSTAKHWGHLTRFRNIIDVVNEIEFIVNKYGIRGIEIRDDTFSLNKSRILDFCNLLLQKNIHIKWWCETRANTIDEEMIIAMKKAGCYYMAMAVESANEKTLKVIRKQITINQVLDVVGYMRMHNVKLKLFFMLGLPGEGKKEIEKTCNFLLEMQHNYNTQPIYSIVTILPGTELEQMAKDKGIISNNFSWTEKINNPIQKYNLYFAKDTPLFTETNMPYEKLCNIVRMSFIKYYIKHPINFIKVLSKNMKYIRKWL